MSFLLQNFVYACLVMYDFDEKIKLQNYAFVDVKIINYNYKHTINHVLVSTMSVIERERKNRKWCLLMQNTTLPKRDILCPWMS